MSVPKSKEKTVSIIIVTYNAVHHLKACLDSIAMQSYTALELVVVDGGSMDGTLEIIKNYSDLIHFWLSEPDKGIYDAMNKGLKYITGSWVYFLGADDTLLPAFSDMLSSELKDTRCIYYANTIFRGEKYKGYMDKYRQAKHGFNHQSMIYPAEVFKKYTYNTRYKISADRMLNIDCMHDPDFEFKYVDLIIANFGDAGVSTLHDDPVFEKEKYRIVFKKFGFLIGIRYLIKGFKDRFIRRVK